ncbi:MAG: hypothetical protein AAGP08_02075 [Pseudomonadota bacterium]
MTPQKHAFRSYLEAFRHPDLAMQDAAVAGFFGNAQINVVHPFNETTMPDLLTSLRGSFDGLYRRDYIAMGGTFEGAEWVTSTGYLVGHFARPWLGIRPTGELAWLRVGEFHRMDGDQPVESYIFLDIPELMIASGQWPIAESPGFTRGYTGLLPGPATQDGLQWHENDPAHSAARFQGVVDMLLGLATKDERWRPYWHENMMWYGPGAFGSFIGIENFASFQVPFEGAFSEWIGGAKPGSMTKHFTRFGDGDYVCSGGWPSLNCVQVKPFLDQPSTGKRLFMRVCDWWRWEGDKLVENWVFVDIPHVLLQLGKDVLSDNAR